MNVISELVRSLTAGSLVIGLTVGFASAQDAPKLTEVFKTPLATAAENEIAVMHVDYPPGYSSPKHFHTGQVLLYVLEGTGALEVDGAVRTAKAGEVIQEAAGKPMVMSNDSTSEWLRFVIFQVGPEGEPTHVKVD